MSLSRILIQLHILPSHATQKRTQGKKYKGPIYKELYLFIGQKNLLNLQEFMVDATFLRRWTDTNYWKADLLPHMLCYSH